MGPAQTQRPYRGPFSSLNLIPFLFGATTTLMSFFGTPAFADTVPAPIVQEQSCSCVRFVHDLIPAVPLVDAVWFQTFGTRTTPAVGRVALLQYGEVSHVAYIAAIDAIGFTVKEANFHKCQKGTRFIAWDSPEIVGFLDFGGTIQAVPQRLDPLPPTL